jgi:hypothetical protein
VEERIMWQQGFWRGLQFLWWWKGGGLLLYKYNEEWDRHLLALLATQEFVPACNSMYIFSLGEVQIWAANHPYASFVPWVDNDRPHIRPSLFTLFLAEEKFVKEIGRKPL